MNRFAAFFSRKIFIICLVFDVPISLLFNYKFTSTRHINFFSEESGRLLLTFLVINYIILLLVFFVLYLISSYRQNQ